ncbi:hypothetical protein RhiJN_09483 [Ceratobasidium sp. AG-Ba]|nr:hypothetical protein RhiJN_09483 [Ceratobasidium sp. AG-Ba]
MFDLAACCIPCQRRAPELRSRRPKCNLARPHCSWCTNNNVPDCHYADDPPPTPPPPPPPGRGHSAPRSPARDPPSPRSPPRTPRLPPAPPLPHHHPLPAGIHSPRAHRIDPVEPRMVRADAYPMPWHHGEGPPQQYQQYRDPPAPLAPAFDHRAQHGYGHRNVNSNRATPMQDPFRGRNDREWDRHTRAQRFEQADPPRADTTVTSTPLPTRHHLGSTTMRSPATDTNAHRWTPGISTPRGQTSTHIIGTTGTGPREEDPQGGTVRETARQPAMATATGIDANTTPRGALDQGTTITATGTESTTGPASAIEETMTGTGQSAGVAAQVSIAQTPNPATISIPPFTPEPDG